MKPPRLPKPPVLLTRNAFRETVLARDNYRCVICGIGGKLDVHHIIERRLWAAPQEFGGYFLDNGASLCEEHHLQAEQSILSCAEIRVQAGITRILLPERLAPTHEYDKWGNPIPPAT